MESWDVFEQTEGVQMSKFSKLELFILEVLRNANHGA